VNDEVIGVDPDERHELRRIGFEWNQWRRTYGLEQGIAELNQHDAKLVDKELKNRRQNLRNILKQHGWKEKS
jgi:hypothetical protein